MGRDVEADLVLNDKVDPGLRSAERKFRASSKRIKDDGDKINSSFAKSVVGLAQSISPKFGASLTKAFAGASAQIGPVLVAGAAAATPLLAATVSAAILTGAGVGAVGIGIAIAAQDARVRAAAKTLGQHVMSELTTDGAVFVQPVLDGIKTIDASFARSSGRIQSILRNASQFVAPLVEGATRGFEGILSGVDRLVAKAGPAIQALSDLVGDLGVELGDFLDSAAGNGEGAAAALRDVSDQLGEILKITGPVIGGLSDLFGWLDKIHLVDAIRTQLLGPLGILVPVLDQATKGTFEMHNGVTQVGAASVGAANGLQSLQEQLDAVTDGARSLFGATTSVGEAIDRVTSAAKSNGKTLDSNTEKGRANRDALANLAGALQKQYEATVQVSGAGARADRVAATNRASFIRLATSLTGSASKARTLADQLLGIPAKKDTKVNANTHDAEARIRALKEQLDALKNKTINVTVHYRGDGSNQNSPSIGGGGGRTFAASNYWAARDGGTSRTGGPVQVSNNLDVMVTPDLSGIRAAWRADIRNSEKRQVHRAQVSP